jgi:hypothetical protein
VQFDHVVLVVDDLEHAVSAFSNEGFNVVIGGINGPTHNAIIAFSDATYIELISLRSKIARRVFQFANALGLLRLRGRLRKDFNNRLMTWFGSSQGLMDLCFRAESVDALLQHSQQLGDVFTPSVPFTRTRPDGVRVMWRLMGACDLAAPFYIEDITERRLRIPEGAAQSHPNGALGIVQIEANQVPQHPVNNVQFVKDLSLAQNEFKVAIRADVTHPKVLDAQKIYGAKIIIQSH